MLLAVTDPAAQPRHRGMSALLVEKEAGVSELPGLTISAPLRKLGYKGIESVELAFDGFRVPAGNVQLRISGNGADALASVGNVQASQTIEIVGPERDLEI